MARATSSSRRPTAKTTAEASHPAPAKASTTAPVGRTAALADHAVRLAALWILAGGVAKATTGLPSELPAPILAADVDPVLVIVVGTFVETFVAITALAAPRVGGIAVAGLLSLFSLLLVGHLAQGGESCGCFGGALPVPASVMLGADLALLALVVGLSARAGILRPTSWRAALGRRVTIGASIGLVAGLSLGAAADARLAAALATEAPDAGAAAGPQDPGSAPTAAQTSVVPAWSLPTTIPEQVLLRPSQWIGQPLSMTALGTWTDTSVFPRTATLVFFYRSCNHCAALLEDLAARQKADPATAPTYVLVQLPTPSAYKGKLFVDAVPEHALWVELPSIVKAYVMTPPWVVEVEDGVVRKAERIQWPGEKSAASPNSGAPSGSAPASPAGTR